MVSKKGGFCDGILRFLNAHSFMIFRIVKKVAKPNTFVSRHDHSTARISAAHGIKLKSQRRKVNPYGNKGLEAALPQCKVFHDPGSTCRQERPKAAFHRRVNLLQSQPAFRTFATGAKSGDGRDHSLRDEHDIENNTCLGCSHQSESRRNED